MNLLVVALTVAVIYFVALHCRNRLVVLDLEQQIKELEHRIIELEANKNPFA